MRSKTILLNFCMYTVRGLNPGGGKIFHTCPDWSWGPPSLLYNGYWVTFPGVKWPGRSIDHPLPSSAEVKERVKLYLYSPSEISWPVLLPTLPFTLSMCVCVCVYIDIYIQGKPHSVFTKHTTFLLCLIHGCVWNRIHKVHIKWKKSRTTENILIIWCNSKYSQLLNNPCLLVGREGRKDTNNTACI